MANQRIVRDIVTIKRTIMQNYDMFRYLGCFYLEKKEVLNAIAAMSDEKIAEIANECREGGVRWKGFLKLMNQVESSLLGGREIIDATQSEEKVLVSINETPVDSFIKITESASGVSVSFNVLGQFDILAKGNRNGIFEISGANITPKTSFTLVDELNPFWEDRYSIALKGENFSFALSTEDPKTGKKGSCCAKFYLLTENMLIADDLGKYVDTSSLIRWINP